MKAANNLLTLIVNLIAALAYTMVAFHRIDWAVAGLIAIGSLLWVPLWPSAFTECVARRDRRGRPHRALPATHRLTGQRR